jgi:predicted amidophosphoribosyltransferase
MQGLTRAAESALRDVSEGACPLCRVALVPHDGHGCCPCCGDTYKASPQRLEMRRCSEHVRTCQHWEAVWAIGHPNLH